MAGIFKKNDIRGVFEENLTLEISQRIAYEFGLFMGSGKSVTVGGDTRLSTGPLKDAIKLGLRKADIHVYDLGVGPTPMMYFSAANFDYIDGAVMITGSHNPPDQNGIKLADKNGASYHYDNLIHMIEEKVKEQIALDDIPIKGSLKNGESLKTEYFEFLSEALKPMNKLKIAVDFGKGATVHFKDVLEENGISVLAFGENPDGTFDGPPPDPAKDRTFSRLKQEMPKDYDLGITFDTDGDRVGFLTPSGSIISPDKVAMMYAEDINKNEPVTLIIDVKVSKATNEYVEELGGLVHLSQVGHSYIYEKLLEDNAHLAAELSGHYYFKDKYYGFDDGLYAAVRFIQILDKMISEGIDLDKCLSMLPEYFTTKEYRDHISYEQQEKILNKIQDYGKNNNAKILQIDGIRAEFDQGWFLVRKSGTEEVLSYRIEGKTPEMRDKLLQDLQALIHAA